MNAKVCAMREIILINSTPFPTIPTLIVNTIHYLPLYKALLEVGINPQCPKDTINALIFTSKHAIKALLQELQTHRDMQDFLKIPAFAIGSCKIAVHYIFAHKLLLQILIKSSLCT